MWEISLSRGPGSDFSGVGQRSADRRLGDPAAGDPAAGDPAAGDPAAGGPAVCHPIAPPGAYPWREALFWMLLLGLLFIVGYRATNQWAAVQGAVLSLHGPWDKGIPFVAWTLWPYVSLNLIFPCTFFAFQDVSALRRHAARIAAVQLASFATFALLPTVNVRPLPQPDGVTGVLYAQLRAFEQPYNMFPSLHAAVLMVTWLACLPALPRHAARTLWHGWCLLILASTVLTWQHDLLDVAGGVGLGVMALAIWPVAARAPRGARLGSAEPPTAVRFPPDSVK